jgi:hypothetical protein
MAFAHARTSRRSGFLNVRGGRADDDGGGESGTALGEEGAGEHATDSDGSGNGTYARREGRKGEMSASKWMKDLR